MTRSASVSWAAAAILGCLLPPGVWAQQRVGPQVRLPANPAQWINSPPLSPRVLRGKGVVLYFFEEG